VVSNSHYAILAIRKIFFLLGKNPDMNRTDLLELAPIGKEFSFAEILRRRPSPLGHPDKSRLYNLLGTKT
jgi:hypothetical protein